MVFDRERSIGMTTFDLAVTLVSTSNQIIFVPNCTEVVNLAQTARKQKASNTILMAAKA